MTDDDPGPGPALTPDVIDRLLLDSTPYLSCDDCFAQLDTYVEAVLADPRHTDLPLQVHLAACGVCAEEALSLIALVSADRADGR